ncbi:MAG TPA: ABC transporter substrate-binding protein [Chloroflexota bacterium]|nr:ABC transporter substrate-binding protein [Chloroflexota bacterium]
MAMVACSGGDESHEQVAPPPQQQAPVAKWQELLSAGKREGEVVILGPEDDTLRGALTETFQRRSGITVRYVSQAGGAQSQGGSAAASNPYDLFVGDPVQALMTLTPNGALDPLPAHLVLDEVTSPDQWSNGGIEYAGPNRELAIMTRFEPAVVVVNANLVGADRITSYRDLLDPSWAGRIIIDDPRLPGSGLAAFTFFYLHPNLGPDFIRALVAQRPRVMHDPDAEAEGIASGGFAALVGGSPTAVQRRVDDGAPIATVDPKNVREGTAQGTGYGSVGIFSHPPHPNAANVYVNWLLSREGQLALAKPMGYTSNRLDVPADGQQAIQPPPVVVTGVKIYGQEAASARPRLAELLEQVLGQS